MKVIPVPGEAKATADDLVAALRSLQTAGDAAEGHTSDELATAWGVSQKTALSRLKALCAAGRMAYAGTRPGVSLVGRPTKVPVYRIVAKGKGK